jgi:hypothetical protein
MSYKQKFVPIIEVETKKVLGYYTLAVETTFNGSETAITLTAGTVPVQLWTPDKIITGKQNPAMMACLLSHAQAVSGDYKGQAEYMDVNQAIPGVQWSSASGAPGNYLQYTNGVIVQGLESGWNVTP